VLARQVLEALAHAHAHGVIHRDLKPDHLFLTAEGPPGREYERVKLIDFGLLELLGEPDDLTEPGMILGTPAYIPPEQALGQPVDGRADLYALAVSLFEMLTGRVPFRSPDALTLVRMHISAPPPSLSQAVPGRFWCTPALEHLLSRALSKRPDDRFATAADMASALEAAFASIDHLPAGT
jgi:serine/threonine-protein kinase